MLTYSKIEEVYNKGKLLYEEGNKKEIEKFFSIHLKTSIDIRLWRLYIDYVKNQQKSTVKFHDVYGFVLAHMEHSYDIYSLVRAYIVELESCSMEEGRIEKVRKAYHQFLKVPTAKLSQLWGDYEIWEVSINKINAKSMLEEIQPFYSNAQSVYLKILGGLQSKNFYRVIDIEVGNPLKLGKKKFESRLEFIFSNLVLKGYDYNNLVILKSFYIRGTGSTNLDNDIPDKNSMTLIQSFWFSFYCKKNYFDFSPLSFSGANLDLVRINYCLWVIQNEGLESFRVKFRKISSEINDNVGYRVYIYAAKIELIYGKNPVGAYNILSDAHSKFGDEPLLCEQFFLMFLKLNDEEKIRLLFKKLGKTERMWRLMIRNCFRYGDFEEYMELLAARDKDIMNNLVLPPPVDDGDDDEEDDLLECHHNKKTTLKGNESTVKGSEGLIKGIYKNFEYLDLKFNSGSVVDKFIKRILPSIPINENLFSNIDFNKMTEILKSIQIE